MALRAADALASVVGAFLPKRHAIPERPQVLVIRCDHIGDAVMATPVLRPLRDALQPSTLDVLAGPWAAPIFENHPAVDHVLTVATPWWSVARGAPLRARAAAWRSLPSVIAEIRARRYDVGIDLRGDLRQIVCFLTLGGIAIRVSSDRTGGASLLTHVWTHDASLHEVEKNVAIAGLLGAAGAPSLAVCAGCEASTLVPEDVRQTGYAVLALRGSVENREWPTEHAAEVVDLLARECGLVSVCVGSAADAPAVDRVAQCATAPVVNLAGRTTLPEAMSVLRGASVAIAVDSGPMHLAAAAGTPVVALFGPGDPRECGPWSTRAEVVALRAPCGCERSRCELTRGPGQCMRAITPAMVMAAVRRML